MTQIWANLVTLDEDRLLWETRPSKILGQFKDNRIEPLIDLGVADGVSYSAIPVKDVKGMLNFSFVIFELVPHNDKTKEQATSYEAKIIKRGVPLSESADMLRDAQRQRSQKLRDMVAEQISALSTKEAEINQQVEDRTKAQVADREQELRHQKEILDARFAKISAKEASILEDIERLTNERVATRVAEINLQEIGLGERAQSLNQKEAELETGKNALENAKKDFEQVGGRRLLDLLSRTGVTISPAAGLERLEDAPVPDSLLKDLKEYLSLQNYSVSESLLLQTLLCSCVAAATGQFVVMTGPPGSGKTSLIKNLADVLITDMPGKGQGLVPVRPAWIDTTDLIGFYHPQLERFQPSPFMDFMVEAHDYAPANRLYFLILDEMNLGRVENYAADFLSQLEKSRAGEEAHLQLYSHEIYGRLLAERDRLRHVLSGGADQEDLDSKSSQLALLLNHIDSYPARVEIPKGLVFFGTINVDETTHLPSPKFLDRSLTIQVANTELSPDLPRNAASEAGAAFSWNLTYTTAQASIKAGNDLGSAASDTWKRLVEWNDLYFKPLGVRLSHRLPQVYRCFLGAASVLKIQDDKAVTEAFILSKIMPLISFRNDECAEGQQNDKKEGQQNETKKDVLERWHDEKSDANKGLAIADYPLVKNALRKMLDKPGLLVRYLE